MFVVYPYICLAVFLMGSLARFDRDQYTWKSDSSQMLRTGTLRWGSNLFHVGILFLFFGHLFGQLTPHWMYEPFISAPQKQLLAIVSGGVAGSACFVGLTLLLHRRIFDPRIRLTSHRTDLAILVILWLQLCLGLVTLPLSWEHRQDAGTMLILASYLQGIATLQPDAGALAGVAWPFKVHMLLGMTIFLLFPFSRLVHVWSGFAAIGLPVPPVPAGAQPAPQRADGPQFSEPAWRRRVEESAIMDAIADTSIASINGVALHAPGESVAPEVLRQRACTELLRQAAQRAGLLAEDDSPAVDGVISEAAALAIETLLEQALNIPEPSEDACRRHHAANEATYRTGERVLARHILFAVTPGVDVVALRKRAEVALLDVRCHDDKSGSRFAEVARALSNCPSGADGGDLGWIAASECAPEFAREVFGHAEIGVLPRLVHSRFGLHVVEVVAREPGAARPFESVRGEVAMALRQRAYVTALRQYLRLLAGDGTIVGVDLDAADTPLLQ